MTTPDESEASREDVRHRASGNVRIRGDFTYSVIETGPLRHARGNRHRDRHGHRFGEDRTPAHLREGVVAERPGNALVECRIREVTTRGARLYLDRDQALPRAFLLRDAGAQQSFRAVLAWQVGREACARLIPIE